MKKFIALTLLSILLYLGISQIPSISKEKLLAKYQNAYQLFLHAEAMADLAGDNEIQQEKADKIFSDALELFKEIIPLAEKNTYDSLLFFSKKQAAYISFYLNDQLSAKSTYNEIIHLKKQLPAIEDSFLFLPLIYTGGIYYNENKFDSALNYYRQAEKIKDTYANPLNESQRLYNRLGAMYYETGNYKQARNYFEKAIAVLNTENNMDEGLLANYQINIAALQIKLEEYEEAKEMYEKVLKTGIYDNEVYHNLAIINLKEEKYNEALKCLNNVHYTNNKKKIELLYNKSMSWSGLNNIDSSTFYLTAAINENKKWYNNRKSISFGLLLKYKADLESKANNYEAALNNYHLAIIQFDKDFNKSDSSKNPEDFSGVFSYINLFNTLVAKADIFQKIYGRDKNIKALQNALETYHSAFKLADYVEKTYDTDEARLFLGKIKYTVHSRPIDISLHLYELTKDKKYIEEAWNFDQRNKASLLSLNLQESEWKSNLAIKNEILLEESNLKRSISRLVLRTQNITDSLLLTDLYSNIRDKEIELGKIQTKINSSPEWQSINAGNEIPQLKDIQKELDKSTAILSFHLSDTRLLIFCITASSINFEYPKLSNELFSNIKLFRNAVQHTKPGLAYDGDNASQILHQLLIDPIQNKITHTKNLIIIPDDELHYLPFEAFQDKNGQYLIENYAIQYLYSASLFKKNRYTIDYSEVLAFAPFANKEMTDSNKVVFKKLPYSYEEIKKVTGEIFVDAAATKNNFLSYSNKYPVLHFATHAAVDNNTPDQSYIAFYPSDNDYLLYTTEIYNLDLDSTHLVILSACETGTGQLVKGEGLMSLSRAFAYAGCPNIITSLWNAEDKSTSFITQQLYHYLKKGYTKSQALQKAKIELLKSKDISPSLKQPNYWAHLILIGEYESANNTNYQVWIIIIISLTIGVILYLIQRRGNNPKNKT